MRCRTFLLFFIFQRYSISERAIMAAAFLSLNGFFFLRAFLIPLHFFYWVGFYQFSAIHEKSERNGRKVCSITDKTGELRNVECQVDEFMNDIFSSFSIQDLDNLKRNFSIIARQVFQVILQSIHCHLSSSFLNAKPLINIAPTKGNSHHHIYKPSNPSIS